MCKSVKVWLLKRLPIFDVNTAAKSASFANYQFFKKVH